MSIIPWLNWKFDRSTGVPFCALSVGWLGQFVSLQSTPIGWLVLGAVLAYLVLR